MRQIIKYLIVMTMSNFLWAQSPVINLGECSFNLVNPRDPLDLPRDGTFRWEATPPAPDDGNPGWYCRDENEADGGPIVTYRVETTYRGRVYGCPENLPPNDNTQACMYHEICNFDPPNTAACISINHDGGAGVLSSNTKNENGDGLFTVSDLRSPCYIVEPPNGSPIDLTTIEPNDVVFQSAVLGIEQHCRDLLFLYQNQLSRTGGGTVSHDVFSLNSAYQAP
ncbi:hypothetical protein N9N67_01060 [Bacteriovoracaceae bacterium]|nr:hypothetical protein [Bacteriovoracaceae bacterium]